MNVTTAFQGTVATPEQKQQDPNSKLEPRLLLFSIGPVQDFIAAARSTRDLWSGSYLLSFLVSHALGKIAREIGPDHLVFPNLLDQPLIDLQLKEDIFAQVKFSEKPVWIGLGYAGNNLSKLLTPSLPNRFMALLPAVHPETGDPVEQYAAEIARSVRGELKKIAGSVRERLLDQPVSNVMFDSAKFDRQVDQLLEIQWQTLAIPKTIEDLRCAADTLLPSEQEPDYTPRKAVDAILKMAEIPACKPQYPINTATGWSLLNALIAYLHDGTKSARSFDAWREGRWQSGKEFNKDSLNGKEEAVLRVAGSDADAESYGKSLGMSAGTLKPGELLGASTLIKRFWHHTYLPGQLGISAERLRQGHPMPNTHAVAAGQPFSDSDEESESRDQGEKYFAVLALDGDEMGKWVSGSKSPKIGEVLSPKAIDFYQTNAADFLKAPRAVTPSWHLQFAEALGNFSFHAVQRIVEAFDGRLLYAGGDDVLAMLPAKDAIRCARALRAAFRGEKSLNELAGKIAGQGRVRRSDRKTRLFNIQNEGFLQLHQAASPSSGVTGGLISDPVDFPAIVPGPRTDVSVGIAIAHFKSPLQDVVKAAQAAEKRAKRSPKEGGLGRGALAISIYKRSGEILEWGTRWSEVDSDGNPTSHETAGYQLFHALSEAMLVGDLNSRFPHKLEALLTPYLSPSKSIGTDTGFERDFHQILALELEHCLHRNEGGSLQPGTIALFTAYWQELAAVPESTFGKNLERFINLLRTAAWSVRGSGIASMPEPAIA